MNQNPPAAPHTPSPLSTGGAGHAYEVRVGALVLVALLRGDRIPGLDGPVAKVGLQQRVAGHVLDDVVAYTTLSSGEPQAVEYQAKRTCKPVKSDTEFVDVVTQCVAAISADPEGVAGGRRQLGLAALKPAPLLATLAELTEIARAHATHDSFHVLLGAEGAVSREVRDRHAHLRAVIGAVLARNGSATSSDVDFMTWSVARALHVWHAEALSDGREALAAINRLADLLPSGQGAAAIAFGKIAEAVAEWAPRAGSIDGPMLRAELERRGVGLTVEPNQRAAFGSLEEATSRLLDPALATLGRRLHLPRQTLRDQLADAVLRHQVVLVTGRAGAGKSVLARLTAQRLRSEGAVVIIIPLTGRSRGISEIEAELGVQLAPALRGAPTQVPRVVIVDGAEQALTDSGRLLRSLLAAVPLDSVLAPPWHVALTARDEAAGPLSELVSDAVGGPRPQNFPVGDLADREITEILTAFPRLQPLDRHERPRALLLRRAYLIDLLLRATDVLELPGQLLGEEDVVDLVYDRLVRRASGALSGQGSPEARSDVYFAMAEAALRNELPARLDGEDANARSGLVSDDVLARIRASYQFAHDILADYAVTTRLLEADGESLLAAAVAPRRLLRAARLWAQFRLAEAPEADLVRIWTQIIAVATAIADRDGPRWLDVPYEAVLHTGAVRQALNALTPTLLLSNAAGLRHLVDVTERLARQRQLPDDAPALPLDLALSAPVIDLLTTLGDRVPDHVRQQATRLVRGRLVAAAESGCAPDDGLHHVALLPTALLTWGRDLEWGDQLEHTIEALALLARHVDADTDAFLLRHGRDRPDRLEFAVERPHSARELAKRRPDLLLLLAGLYYLGHGLAVTGEDPVPGRTPPPRWYLGEDEDGVRNHAPQLGIHGLAGPTFGPFAALLAADSEHGRRLVGAVVDAATRARISIEASWGAAPLTVGLQLPGWPAERRFQGTSHVWLWYRRLGVGAYPAMSALMALREWAVGRVRGGEPLSSVVASVLGCGESLALVAVAVSVLVDSIDRVGDELDPFLEHPLLWHLEIARVTQEDSGLALRLPDAPRLRWMFSQVAMGLVINGNQERRASLRRIGERLIEHHRELAAESGEAPAENGAVRQAELLARRWAAELDIERYRFEDHEQGLAVRVDYPEDVLRGLDEGGGREAQLWLELHGLAFRAMKARDDEPDAEDAGTLWRAVEELRRRIAAEPKVRATPSEETDAAAAAAAAMVLASLRGARQEPGELRRALSVLRDVAEAVARAATGGDTEEVIVPKMAWSQGADRSAAMALPMLLVDRELRERAGLSMRDTERLVIGLATSPLSEVRGRLAKALDLAWPVPCRGRAPAHHAAIAALRMLVGTAGLGRLTAGARRSRERLAEPLEKALVADDSILDPATASDALSGLISASRLSCIHGERARRLLDALLCYDRTVWPTHLARRHYDVGAWRDTLDALAAGRILDGEHTLLNEYLSAFAPVAEDLRGLLAALAAAATTPQRAAVLHDIWPRVFDALLPTARMLRSDGPAHLRASYHHVHALDEALLPLPPEGTDWPLARTVQLLSRWVQAYRDRPHVADRLINVLMRCGWLGAPNATGAVLLVLGDRIETIQRDSRLVVPWLKFALQKRPSAAGQHAASVRRLLDRLAAAGHEAAIQLQKALEA